MVTRKQIEEFLGSEPIAMAGVSRNPKKFGFAAFKELKEKGMNVIPVNPYAEEIHGCPVYKDIMSLPDNVRGLIIMTGKNQTASVIRDAKTKGIKQIWIQQMAESKEDLSELEGSGINYITKECILMHYKPHSIHKFHAALRKFFGRFPK
ncbi:MAG TPA: CoA-binding protein [Bacteroidales bacterium]|jgi:predicted CoA-binding protein|nr:CoA-binding protein [Bacteroidales bacterium]